MDNDKIKNQIIESAKRDVMYWINLGFIGLFAVAFSDFIADIAKEDFGFKQYYFIKPLIILIFYFIIRKYIKTRKN